MPSSTGLLGHKFQPCPITPNCVSSTAPPQDKVHYIAPLQFKGSREKAQQRLLAAVAAMGDAHQLTLIKMLEHYWYFEFRTPVLKFCDDVEFYFPPRQNVIHMRSASRIGYSDWGTNRKRLEAIRAAFETASAKPFVALA